MQRRILGLTGGVACGKSTFAAALSEALSARHIETDRLAKQLMTTDPAIRERMASAFGDEIFDSAGELDRRALREVIFADDAARKRLESIVHPAVRSVWQHAVTAARAAGERIVVEIPLLFEVGVEAAFDAIVVVAASESTQVARLTGRRGLTESMARKILASQMPIGDKVTKADHVIWNDSGLEFLQGQATYLADFFSRPNV